MTNESEPPQLGRRGILKAAAGVSLSAAALPLLTATPATALTYAHPGMLHTSADISRMGTQVAAGNQPWADGWSKLTANPHAANTWTPNPAATVYRGSGYPENYAQLFNDAAAAYQNALRWKVTGISAYGACAANILNAWSSTLTLIDGSPDKYLAAGIYGYEMANAGELMRGYSGFDLTAFKNMLLNVFYPLNNDFLLNHNGAYITNYWASWDLCTLASVLSIGILCDDETKVNQAVDYFKTGAGNGSIGNAIPYVYDDQGLAQWQESGRDQGHTLLGIGLMGTVCEMAWHQGIDLYGYDSNRFMKAAEYVAKYNLGEGVPWTDYTWVYGQPGVWGGSQTFTQVSSTDRGQKRPIWAQLYDHYAVRKGLFVPNIAAMAKVVEPEGGGGDYGPNGGGYDHLGFTTLTSTEQARTTLPTGVTRSLQSINFPASYASYGSDNLGYLTQVTSSSSSTVKQQASFTIVPGLADGKGYSFRLSDGRYLRHSGFRIRAAADDGTTAFKQDATFYALRGATSGSVRLVSYNYPGRCIRHRSLQLWVDPYDELNPGFRDDSSFTPVTAWA